MDLLLLKISLSLVGGNGRIRIVRWGGVPRQCVRQVVAG